MQKIRKITIIAAFIFVCCGIQKLNAQSAYDLRINEYLVYNDSNYVDDYGMRGSWIEIFNTAYNSVNMGGLYLTDDLENPKKYPILKGQSITKIPARSYLVFWADEITTRGILHLNFKIGESNKLAIFSESGDIIDSCTIVSGQKSDVSYGRLIDGGADWGYLIQATPNNNNETVLKKSTAESFGEMDPTGAAMSIIAMSVVFIGLALLYFFFKGMSKVLMYDFKKKRKESSNLVSPKVLGEEMTGEVNAAIAMALFIYSNELHDDENAVLTMTKVSRTYSPWSSKLYGLTKSPR